jgi:hypothetical protein
MVTVWFKKKKPWYFFIQEKIFFFLCVVFWGSMHKLMTFLSFLAKKQKFKKTFGVTNQKRKKKFLE